MSDELKKAYETLGLPEGAAREQVEKQYELLLKKARTRQMRASEVHGDPPLDLQAINRAYKLLTEAAQETASAGGPAAQKHPLLEKLEHYFYYYKFHMLGALVLIVLIIFSVKGYMDQRAEREALAKLPPAAATVSFFGDFYIADTDKIGSYLAGQIPGWQRVAVSLTQVPKEIKSDFDVALQQKSVIALISEHPDVYIMDSNTFKSLMAQGALLSLDEYASAFQPYMTEANAYRGQAEGDRSPQLYGLDVTGSSLFQTFPIRGEQKIVGIRRDSQQRENAVKLITWLLQSARTP